MTARELAALLLRYPDLEVFVRDYEGGVNPVQLVLLTDVAPMKVTFGGHYTIRGEYFKETEIQGRRPALFIGYDESLGDGLCSVEGTLLIQ